MISFLYCNFCSNFLTNSFRLGLPSMHTRDWSAISGLCWGCCDWSVLVGPLSLAFVIWSLNNLAEGVVCSVHVEGGHFIEYFLLGHLFKRDFVRKWQRNVKLQKGYLYVHSSSICRLHIVQLFSCRFPIHFVGGESRRLDRICSGTFYFLFSVTHASCYLGCIGQYCITYTAFYGRSGVVFYEFCITV